MIPESNHRTSYFQSQRLTVLEQVEYASKAVENGGTAIGIRCKDGVVLALEKIITSKLLKPGANKRIASVDRNFGMVYYHPFTKCKHDFPGTGLIIHHKDILRLDSRWKTSSFSRPR